MTTANYIFKHERDLSKNTVDSMSKRFNQSVKAFLVDYCQGGYYCSRAVAERAAAMLYNHIYNN